MSQDDRKLLQVKMAVFFGFALVIVGAFMPWATVGPFSQSGLDGDGVLTLLLASLGSLIAFFDRRPRGMLIAVSVAAMALIIGIVDLLDVAGSTAGSVGIGLYFTVVGAFIATVASGLVAFSLFKRPAAPEAEKPEEPSDES